MVQRSLLLPRGLALGAALVLAGCMTRPVDLPPASVVFFTPFSAAIDGPGNAVIAQFAQDAKGAPLRTVYVSGYADRSGSTDANVKLSATRAQVVADGLVAAGVAQGRIVQQPHGSVGGDPGIESRRVELTLGR